ncbi:hypothetical protein BDQ12DRAFT_675767 [Crucibulum laeve]|uniref:Uncharacterized protein n=1 Tax=Crucibulum laeve TaxID=68775 RepID=A0A5C3MF99_9AGAR|nr:hypothetical protein BDQ12DRAFT_675767 [Crucibulum laeve]
MMGSNGAFQCFLAFASYLRGCIFEFIDELHSTENPPSPSILRDLNPRHGQSESAWSLRKADSFSPSELNIRHIQRTF